MVASPSGYLLDTNVISELMKRQPARGVAEWIEATPEELLYLSVLTVGEIRKGIDLLDENDPKRAALQSWLDRDLRIRFAGRVLSFDAGAAERWGQVEAFAKRQRRTIPTIDAQRARHGSDGGAPFTSDADHERSPEVIRAILLGLLDEQSVNRVFAHFLRLLDHNGAACHRYRCDVGRCSRVHSASNS